MPFDQRIPRPFTAGAIQTYAPSIDGIYGISNAREWLYIGQADNIRGALLVHLRDVQASIMKRDPTGFVFEVCSGTLRSARQDRLVQEYEPACNRMSARHS